MLAWRHGRVVVSGGGGGETVARPASCVDSRRLRVRRHTRRRLKGTHGSGTYTCTKVITNKHMSRTHTLTLSLLLARLSRFVLRPCVCLCVSASDCACVRQSGVENVCKFSGVEPSRAMQPTVILSGLAQNVREGLIVVEALNDADVQTVRYMEPSCSLCDSGQLKMNSLVRQGDSACSHISTGKETVGTLVQLWCK